MRVLYLDADPGVPVFGTKGASVHVRCMAEAMARAGHEVAVLAARIGPLPAQPPGFLVMPEIAAAPPRGPGAAWAEVAAMEVNDRFGDAVRRLARSFRPDVIYERYSLWGDAGVEAARALRLPHLLEVNAPLVDEAWRWRGLHHVDEARAAARRIFSGTTVALAVSRGVADYAEGHGAGRVHPFPNAVDATLFRHKPRSRTGQGPLTLGFCGSLRPWHGVETLVHALAWVRSEVHDARLLVVGDGAGRDVIARAAQVRGLEHCIEFSGAVEHGAIPDWLARMDVALALHPRIVPFYFSPLKIFEYQAAGLPVVATSQGDMATYIDHGRTGVLVAPDDIEEAAHWIVQLHRDPGLAARMGAAARAEVLGRHTWDLRVGEMAALVAEVGRTEGART